MPAPCKRKKKKKKLSYDHCTMYVWFCAYGKCNDVLALFDPLSQKRHLAIKLLGRIKILLSFVVVARCTCHRFGARLCNQYCKSTVEKCYQEIMLAAVMIYVCTVSLTRVFISPLEPGNGKTQQIAMGWLHARRCQN